MEIAKGVGGQTFPRRDPIPWLIGLLGALVVCEISSFALAGGDAGFLGHFTGAATVPAGIAVLLIARRLVADERADIRARRAWAIVAVAVLADGVGALVRYVSPVLPEPELWLATSTLLELAAFPIIWIALSQMPRAAQTRDEAVIFGLDVAVVAWSVAILLWHFVLYPVAYDDGADAITTVVMATFPAADISIAFALAAMVLRGLLPTTKGAAIVAAAAFIALFMADVLSGLDSIRGTYLPGGSTGILYSAAWVGLAMAVYFHARVPPSSRPIRGLAGYATNFPWFVYLIAGIAFVAPLIPDWNQLALLQLHLPGVGLLMGLLVVRLAATARQNASLAAEERGRLAAAVDQAAESMLTTDKSGRITYVNRAFTEITGYPAEEAIGREPAFLREDADPERLADMYRTLAQGEVWKGRLRDRRRDGTTVELDIAVAPLREATGAIAGSVEVSRDISREMALEDQLDRAQRMEAVGRLAGGIAHDFNNILTAISGFTELAMDRVGPDGPATEELAEIARASDRAAGLTKALLTFGRRGVMARQNVDLNVVVDELQPMLQVVLGENIELVVRKDPAIGLALTDRTEFDQVVVNLVMNARDAMPHGGKVGIETSNFDVDAEYSRMHVGAAPGPFVRLAVSDTGTGMTREVLDHAFEPFFTTKPRGKGTGLGLSTVVGVVQASGGLVNAVSSPGQGTVITILLPRVEGVADRQDETPRGVRVEGGRETILVAEDEEAVRVFIERVLARAGYRVVAAANGSEALSLAAQLPHLDLLFTDMVMPGMSGRELATQLSALYPGLRRIFASGYTEDPLVRGLTGQSDPFLSKPFTAEALLERVRSVLDS
jgi:PAS domain S-box-containing protein